MKLERIETPDYVLAVSDEEPKTGNWIVELENLSVWQIQIQPNTIVSRYKKIIAYQPKNNAPELELPLLPEMVVEDDVEKLAEKHIENYEVFFDTKKEIDHTKIGFIAGYKAATKKYSEEDLKKALFDFGDVLFNNCQNGILEEDLRTYENDILQSLKQPTPKWFVAETIQKSINGSIPVNQDWEYELKTTTNSEGKKVLFGKYLYE
jgi:hypothetical protein